MTFSVEESLPLQQLQFVSLQDIKWLIKMIVSQECKLLKLLLGKQLFSYHAKKKKNVNQFSVFNKKKANARPCDNRCSIKRRNKQWYGHQWSTVHHAFLRVTFRLQKVVHKETSRPQVLQNDPTKVGLDTNRRSIMRFSFVYVQKNKQKKLTSKK